MAQRTDVGGGLGTATLNPNDPPELPASTTGTSTPGANDQGVAQQAKEQAKNLANEAKDQTMKVAEQARDQVQELVGRQKDEAAERLGSVAQALREAGRKLQEGDQSGDFGRYADRAAEQVERLSGYLRDNDLRGFVRDTESFARRRPEVFLGGAFLAGLTLARFLKSSAPERPGHGPYSAGYRASTYPDTYPNRSSYTPERRNPDQSPVATGGTTAYNAPLGV
jgi:hypothetical protein